MEWKKSTIFSLRCGGAEVESSITFKNSGKVPQSCPVFELKIVRVHFKKRNSGWPLEHWGLKDSFPGGWIKYINIIVGSVRLNVTSVNMSEVEELKSEQCIVYNTNKSLYLNPLVFPGALNHLLRAWGCWGKKRVFKSHCLLRIECHPLSSVFFDLFNCRVSCEVFGHVMRCLCEMKNLRQTIVMDIDTVSASVPYVLRQPAHLFYEIKVIFPWRVNKAFFFF